MSRANRILRKPSRTVLPPLPLPRPVHLDDAKPSVSLPHTPAVNAGLEDVTVCQSAICFIDGHLGRLIYRGYDAIDLAEGSSFEEVTYLLWHGRLPGAGELAAFRAMPDTDDLPWPIITQMRLLPVTAHPMSVLRTAVSALEAWDDGGDTGVEATLRTACRLLRWLPWLVATHHRIRRGLDPVMPCPDKSIADNFLYTLHGQEPTATALQALDAALILHADHELNASTFAARVTAATLTDIYSALTSAIGALKGSLHGGANEQVIRMLDEIGTPDLAEAWVLDALAHKRKVPGFGHRVYRTDDPRATVLRAYAAHLSHLAGDTRRFDISVAVEQAMRRYSKVYPNVDFYSGICYTAMGIPADLFTPIFACSRLAGWIAHILEQWEHNRLIRPKAEYTGPMDLVYRPVD